MKTKRTKRLLLLLLAVVLTTGLLTASAAYAEEGETHTITIADMQHGTVTASPEAASAGNSVTLTVTPEDGYGLFALEVKDSDGNAVPVENLTFTMPDSDVTVSATFKKPVDSVKYVYDGGTSGVSGEGPSMLTDGNKTTKWCIENFTSAYTEFHSKSVIVPVGYTLTTGNDNMQYPNRNPKNWVIKAKLNPGDEWTTIATVTDDTVLHDNNRTDYSFPITGCEGRQFQYFRFEVSATQGSDVMQLSEFAFKALVDETNLANATVEINPNEYLWTGSAIHPEPVVKDAQGTTLEKGTHYTVSYSGACVETGTYTATVTAIPDGGYTGSNSAQFRIYKIYISNCNVSLETRYPATGSEIKPVPVVTYKGETLIEGTDYTLSYEALDEGGDFKTPGDYKVIITAADNCKFQNYSYFYYRIYQAVTVDYVDAAGETHTQENVCVLDEEEYRSGLEDGWYAVMENLDIEPYGEGYSAWAEGDVNLILCDGATMTITSPSCVLYGPMDLTVYGQKKGTGKLVVDVHDTPGSTYYSYSAYAMEIESFTIESGAVAINAKSSSYGATAFTAHGDILVKGGSLTCTATGSYGRAIQTYYGGVRVEGGTLTATMDVPEENGYSYGDAAAISTLPVYSYEYMMGHRESRNTREAFRGTDDEDVTSESSDIVITGGTVIAKANGIYDVYAINALNGNVLISGGEVTAEATGRYAFGIVSTYSDAHYMPMPIGSVGVRAAASDEPAAEPQAGVTISGGKVDVTTNGQYVTYGVGGEVMNNNGEIGPRKPDDDDDDETEIPEVYVNLTGGELTVKAEAGYGTAVFGYNGVNITGGTNDLSFRAVEATAEPSPTATFYAVLPGPGEAPASDDPGEEPIEPSEDIVPAVVSFGDINVTGGQNKAIASTDDDGTPTGFHTFGGSILLGWTEDEDFIQATTYTAEADESDVAVAEKQHLTDGTNLYDGTLTEAELTAAEGKKLVPAFTIVVNTPENGTASADLTFGKKGDVVTLTTKPADGYLLDEITVTGADGKTVTVTDGTFKLPAADVTVTVTFREKYTYTVIWEDGDGSELDRKTYIEGETEPTTTKKATKAEDAQNTYTFSKWDDGTMNGTTKTYKPIFTATPKPAEASVVWDEADVQFKGKTPYVIWNGKEHTPGFTVVDKDGNTIDPADYEFEYAGNVDAGSGFVNVTLKDGVKITAFFKIYLPPTAETTIENTADGIKLTWAAVEGAEGYIIYRRAWNQTSDDWTTFERWFNTTDLTWTDGTDDTHKVYAGSRYQYGVKAYFAQHEDPVNGQMIGGVFDNYNLGVVGPLVTEVRISTRKVTKVSGSEGKLTVQWEGSKVFTGYQVQVATDKAFTSILKNAWVKTPERYHRSFKNLTPDTTYYVRVRSYHWFDGKKYYGEWSNVMSGKVK